MDASTTRRRHYSHRAKPYSNELELELTAHELVAVKGRSRQVFPLGAFERIALDYSPRNTARLVFRCRLRATDGRSLTFDSLSWKSLVQTERQDADYAAFVTALIERAAAMSPAVTLEAGTGPLRYRLMQAIGLALIAAIALAAVMIFRGGSAIVAAGSGALAVYFGLWLREYLTRNRPRRFTAQAIPHEVMPPASPPRV